jgi:hypothetical protein
MCLGNFYLGGQKAVIWKLDKSLNTLWRRVYYYGDWEDDSYLYSINQWSDGGLVGVGTYYDRYLNPNWEATFSLAAEHRQHGLFRPRQLRQRYWFCRMGTARPGHKSLPQPRHRLHTHRT